MTTAPMDKSVIKLVLSDVDGTLVTQDKVLTEASIDVVRRLGEAGVLFAVTSGRPPKGMEMLVEPLHLTTPIAAFNGGMLVDKDMRVVSEHLLPDPLVQPVTEVMETFGLDVWVYRGAEWYVLDDAPPHVAREARTVGFDPVVVASFAGLTTGVAKLVGVSDDHEAVGRAVHAVQETFGSHVAAATSQPYYLDVTHPDANKGSVAVQLAERYGISPREMAAIGDMPNDVLMFAHAGVSIAMGNADPQVQRAARYVTGTNDDDGFSQAMERFVLHRAPSPA